ncbi:hypothetical protein [Roseobacter weihaiensis]|uniref:hypothetical protein n=1 Tax=Roseobacter weihaiensis TaxID=2763262 RepID=UPI001D0B0B3D|nr:hypothetical protein [Roseobacter sp. H9]
MARKHKDPKTALQGNYGFAAVDDYDMRMYVLPTLLDPEGRAAIIAEHRALPVYAATQPGEPAPMYSDVLTKLIDKLRTVPMRGKHTIVEVKPWEEYAIGFLPGQRGGRVEISAETYPTREDAEHAIFLKRLEVFLAGYGIEM